MSPSMFQLHSSLYLQQWLDWQFSYFRCTRFDWHFQCFNHVRFDWHMNCLHLLHVSWHFNCFRLSLFVWQFNYFQCSYFSWHFTDSFTPIIRFSEDTSTTHLFQPTFHLLIDQGKSRHSSAEAHNRVTTVTTWSSMITLIPFINILWVFFFDTLPTIGTWIQ